MTDAVSDSDTCFIRICYSYGGTSDYLNPSPTIKPRHLIILAIINLNYNQHPHTAPTSRTLTSHPPLIKRGEVRALNKPRARLTRVAARALRHAHMLRIDAGGGRLAQLRGAAGGGHEALV